MIWLSAFFYFFLGMLRFGLVIDTDDWGILFNSRLLLDGQIVGDPNKTFSMLVGLLTDLLDDPWVFPFVSSLLGAGPAWGSTGLLSR